MFLNLLAMIIYRQKNLKTCSSQLSEISTRFNSNLCKLILPVLKKRVISIAWTIWTSSIKIDPMKTYGTLLMKIRSRFSVSYTVCIPKSSKLYWYFICCSGKIVCPFRTNQMWLLCESITFLISRRLSTPSSLSDKEIVGPQSYSTIAL